MVVVERIVSKTDNEWKRQLTPEPICQTISKLEDK